MRSLGSLMLILAVAGAAQADLQNVTMGGELRIRGRHFGDILGRGQIPSNQTLGRSYGPYGYDSACFKDLTFVEQRSVLHLKADFTDNVGAFIEFENWGRWGEDFRSNWATGADGRGADNVELFQAYTEINEAWGMPLRLRIGRQELMMGKAWLVGSQVSPTLGISYDAIRATWDTDQFTVDAWWAKLADNFAAAQDDDVDFYGVYGTYKGLEHLDLSAYWLFVRDGRSGRDLTGARVRDIFGLDDYDPSEMHTVGLRAWGAYNKFSYDLELAYQFGEADGVGALFTLPVTGFGDPGAEYDNWAGDLTLNYAFDTRWNPVVSVGAAYFGGEDKREAGFLEWLNPLQRPDASVSFNRLFSGVWYASSFDILGGASALSNFWQLRAGVTVTPLEKVSVGLSTSYFGAVDTFSSPAGHRGKMGLMPWLPDLGFWTRESSDDLGWVSHIWAKYRYSPDWWFKIGYENIVLGDGLKDGNYIQKNGLDLLGGAVDGVSHYIYCDTQVKF